MISEIFELFKEHMSNIPEVQFFDLYSNFSYDESKNNRYPLPAVLIEFLPSVVKEYKMHDEIDCTIKLHIVQSNVNDDNIKVTLLIDKISTYIRNNTQRYLHENNDGRLIQIWWLFRTAINFNAKVINNFLNESTITYQFRVFEKMKLEQNLIKVEKYNIN